MKYSLYINQVKAIEWGLNPQQAILFSFLYELPSWANSEIINGEPYYWVTKPKIIEELPLLTDKPDTIKRLIKQLEEKGLVSRAVKDKCRLYVKTTKLGKTWNDSHEQVGKKIPTSTGGGREKNPQGGREKNPPNKITIDKDTSNKNTNLKAIDNSNVIPLPEWLDTELWYEFLGNRKKLKCSNSPRSIKTLINKLKKLEGSSSGSGNEALENANVHGWKSIYPPKDNLHSKKPANVYQAVHNMSSANPDNKYGEVDHDGSIKW